MKKRFISMLIILAMMLACIPSAAFAETEAVPELHVFYPWHLENTEEDGVTFTLRNWWNFNSHKEPYEVEHGGVFILAEKVIENGVTKYRAIEDFECTDDSAKIESWEGWYQGEKDRIIYSSIITDELGEYTLTYKGAEVKINVIMPAVGFYTEPEATFDNLIKESYDYVAGKDNKIYWIASEYLITDWDTNSFTSEFSFQGNSPEFAELKVLDDNMAVITVNKYVPGLNVHIMQHADRDNSGNGYYIRMKNVIADGIQSTTIKASSKKTNTSSGKPAVKVSWSKSKGYSVDKYLVYMSTKKSSGYEKVYTTKNGKQTSVTISKNLKKGKTYYFKIRGARKVEGKTYYTNWSNKTSEKL